MNNRTLSDLKDSLITYVPDTKALKILMKDDDARFIVKDELGLTFDLVLRQLDLVERFDEKTFPWLYKLVSDGAPSVIPELLQGKRKNRMIKELTGHKERLKNDGSARLRLDVKPWEAYVAAVDENDDLWETATHKSVTPIIDRVHLLESISANIQKNIKTGDSNLQRSTAFLQTTGELLLGRGVHVNMEAIPAYMWEDSFWGETPVEYAVSYLQKWSRILKNPLMYNKIIVQAGVAQSKVGDEFVKQANPNSKLRRLIQDLNFSANSTLETGKIGSHLSMVEFAEYQVNGMGRPLPSGAHAHFLGKHFPVILSKALIEQDSGVLSKLVKMGIIRIPWDADGSSKMNPASLLASLISNWELTHWFENYSDGLLNKPELASVMRGNKKFVKRAMQAGEYQTALEAMKGLISGDKVAVDAKPLQGFLNFLDGNNSSINQTLLEDHVTLSCYSADSGEIQKMADADKRFASIMIASPEYYLYLSTEINKESSMGETMRLLQGAGSHPYQDKPANFWEIVRDLALDSYDMKVSEMLSVAESALQ